MEITVQVAEAGVASVRPPAVARAWNVYAPSARPVYAFGDEHAANASASSLHSKVEPAWVDVNENDALVLYVGVEGCAVIVVSGAVAGSVTVQPYETAALTFPAGSVARTRKVCALPEMPEYDAGETQAANASVSREHSNAESSLAKNPITAVVAVVGFAGPELTVTVGAVVSTVVSGPGGGHGGVTLSVARDECCPPPATASTPKATWVPQVEPVTTAVVTEVVPPGTPFANHS